METFNLYYWEGPGTEEFMVLHDATTEMCAKFKSAYNNVYAQYRMIPVNAPQPVEGVRYGGAR